MTMTTTEKVLAIRQRDPRRLAKHMAAEIGVSRERVRQILIKLGLPTSFYDPPRCIDCRDRVSWNTKRCAPCRHKSVTFEAACGWCGEILERYQSAMKTRHKNGAIFCNRSHRSKRNARLFAVPMLAGLTAHRERVRKGLALLDAAEALDAQSSG